MQGRLDAAPGASLEVVVADITKPDSLKPDLFLGVRAVICCTAVNVSPKEGDTPNRDKYKQVRPLRPSSLNRSIINIVIGCRFRTSQDQSMVEDAHNSYWSQVCELQGFFGLCGSCSSYLRDPHEQSSSGISVIH